MPTSTHRPCSVDDDFLSPIEDKIDNMSNFNHMSGSYSNLYREKVDDEQLDGTQNIGTRNMSTHANNEIVENVYCNIPPQYSAGQNSNEYSNSNLHLYSNLTLANEIKDEASMMTAVASPSTNTNTPFKSPHCPASNQSTHKPDPMSSSTMQNDDLDLDDPVMVGGNINKVAKKSTKQNVDHSSSDIGRKPPISIEMKQVSDSMSTKADRQANNHNVTIDSTVNRLLLHDTMIDTALDLDSLDGINLDNSQACLVNKKTVA